MSEPMPAPGGVPVLVCPLPASALPSDFRRHVDPLGPVPMRMMAAKGLVPLQPSDMVGALFLLTFDPDANIRETAQPVPGSPHRFNVVYTITEGPQVHATQVVTIGRNGHAVLIGTPGRLKWLS